jgi:hypothetical protein
MKMRAFWDIAPYSLGVDRRFRGTASIITVMMTEAVHTSETSVYSNETALRYISERSYLNIYLQSVVFTPTKSSGYSG